MQSDITKIFVFDRIEIMFFFKHLNVCINESLVRFKSLNLYYKLS